MNAPLFGGASDVLGESGFADVSRHRLGAGQSEEMLKSVWEPYAAWDEENVKILTSCELAQLVALTDAHLLTAAAAGTAGEALLAVMRNPSIMHFDPRRGDLYFNFEAHLVAALGPEIGGALHLGRSRIDLIAALMRLRARAEVLELLRSLQEFRLTVLGLAQQHMGSIMQAYTHLQPAQVTTLGHYLAALLSATERDMNRLLVALHSVNQSPLGAAATSGSSWPIDRRRLATLLGFEGLIVNTKDAGSNYDWLPELLGSVSILMSTVGRTAWDLYIWASHEFSLVQLSGSMAASSSIMPQKRNPYSLEMIRARASTSATVPASALMALHGDTGGTAFDIKLVGQTMLVDHLSTATGMVDLLRGVLRTAAFDTARMRENAGSGFSTAVGLVEELVRREDLPFRTAHLIVGALVRLAEERDIVFRQVTGELLDEAATQVLGRAVGVSTDAIQAALDPEAFIANLVVEGSPNPLLVAGELELRADEIRRGGKMLADIEAVLDRRKVELIELAEQMARG